MILNSVLDDDVIQLKRNLAKHQQWIDFVGYSGDSPLHMAVYKQNEEMLSLLLYFGATPNNPNSSGDTAFHTACRIGNFKCLALLYESGRCNLEIPNYDGVLVCDLCQHQVEDCDVNLLQLYGQWDSNFNFEEAKQNMAIGREKCGGMSSNKLCQDNALRRQYSILTMIGTNVDYDKSVNIIRGKGHFDDRVFKSELKYATPTEHIPRHIIDHDRLRGDSLATEKAVTGIFAADLTERLLRTGVYGTSLAAVAARDHAAQQAERRRLRRLQRQQDKQELRDKRIEEGEGGEEKEGEADDDEESDCEVDTDTGRWIARGIASQRTDLRDMDNDDG